LVEAGISNVDGLADLATDELQEIAGLAAESASSLIMAAREIAFEPRTGTEG
jgi:N utilization substance protein A